MPEDHQKDNDLESQDWYHGIRPRRDVQPLLKNPGDWLVRATDNRMGKPEIVISAMPEKGDNCHFTLKFDNVEQSWHLGCFKNNKKLPKFKNVVALIEFYKKKGLPKCPLKKHIPRPKILIKHDSVKFDRAKDLLGSGNFCHVYKGIYQQTPTDKITVAVKICHENRESTDDKAESRKARNEMLSEAQIMVRYIHKNIVSLYGMACDHPPVLIVMEFCSGGNLEKHLVKYGEKITDGERIHYMIQAAQGMRYLHDHNCIHRDLASRNCLISKEGRIKISDFGLSRLTEGDTMDLKTEEDDEDKADGKKDKGPQVPIRWMAPESLVKPQVYSFKSDVWSFGVLLFETWNNGIKPWPDPNEPPKKIATMIRKANMPSMPEKTPAEVKEIVGTIWIKDAATRPDMRQLVKALMKTVNKYPKPAANQMIIYQAGGVERAKDTQEDTDDQEEENGPVSLEEKDKDRGTEANRTIAPLEPVASTSGTTAEEEDVKAQPRKKRLSNRKVPTPK